MSYGRLGSTLCHMVDLGARYVIFFLKQILFRLKLLQAGPVLPFIPVYSAE